MRCIGVGHNWLCSAIISSFCIFLLSGQQSVMRLSKAFVTEINNRHYINNPVRLRKSSLRALFTDENVEIPPYHIDAERVKAQVLQIGPEIPGEAWEKPERPPGFVGYKGMASDFRFCKPDRTVMGRMMRRKYKQVIYRNVRAKYKRFIKDARNVAELMYWQAKLDSLPTDSSKTRYNRICMLTGRTRAVYRVVGLTRHKFREFAYKGLIPGIRRANW